MPGIAVGRGGGAPPSPRPGHVAPPVVVAVAAAIAALALGGHGLLVPAGSSTTLVRVGGALVALAAVAALVRLDGPARGARMLTLVAVVGALTGLATLPASPVSLDDAPGAPPSTPERSPDDGTGTIWLDRPGHDQGGAGEAGTLVLPPGAALELDGDDLLLRLPDGSTGVVGDAGRPAGPGTAPAPGDRPGVQAVPSGGGVVVTRSDGRPLGPGVGVGGVPFEGPDGRRVVVGGGVLLDVPEPLPSAPGADPGVDHVADGVEAVLALLLAGFALLAFAPPVVRVAGRMSEPVAVADPPARRAPAPAAATVEEGLAEVLRAMLADPDPRTAVIGAYARLLAALDEVGFARRAEEGPHEHLWRALGPLGVRRAPLHRLAELFVRARFTPRPVTEVHRQTAIRCLADAVGDLRLQAGDVDALVGSPALASSGRPGR